MFQKEASYQRISSLVMRVFSPLAAEVAMTICGLWCLLTPLLLWVAWTEQIFLFILLSGVLSCVVFCTFSIAISPEPKPKNTVDIWRQRQEQFNKPALPKRQSTWRDLS